MRSGRRWPACAHKGTPHKQAPRPGPQDARANCPPRDGRLREDRLVSSLGKERCLLVGDRALKRAKVFKSSHQMWGLLVGALALRQELLT